MPGCFSPMKRLLHSWTSYISEAALASVRVGVPAPSREIHRGRESHRRGASAAEDQNLSAPPSRFSRFRSSWAGSRDTRADCCRTSVHRALPCQRRRGGNPSCVSYFDGLRWRADSVISFHLLAATPHPCVPASKKSLTAGGRHVARRPRLHFPGKKPRCLRLRRKATG